MAGSKQTKEGSQKKRKPWKKLALLSFVLIFLLGVCLGLYRPESKSELKITITHPQNETYSVKNVILNVSTNFLVSEISRSIDGSAEYVECMNCTGFTRYNLIFNEGSHTVKVYAKNLQSSAEATVIFTVKLQ